MLFFLFSYIINRHENESDHKYDETPYDIVYCDEQLANYLEQEESLKEWDDFVFARFLQREFDSSYASELQQTFDSGSLNIHVLEMGFKY